MPKSVIFLIKIFQIQKVKNEKNYNSSSPTLVTMIDKKGTYVFSIQILADCKRNHGNRTLQLPAIGIRLTNVLGKS